LLYRSDREYDEAIKCYKSSIRMERDNLNVLRDLAQLQIQMRDLPGFLETRQTLLELKPNNRQNWVSLGLAHHLLGNYEIAATVLSSYEATLDAEAAGSEAYEHSEILLYRMRILEEGGKPEEAMAALKEAQDKGLIKDKLGAKEMAARLLLAGGKGAEAAAAYRDLLRINPEDHKYHEGLRAALGADATEAAAAVYAELQAEHPHSTAARRIPLDFLKGPAFESAADAFVRRYLSKGIPSLFSELKPLYSNSDKAETLGGLFSRLEESLKTTGSFPAQLGSAGGAPAADAPPRVSRSSPQSLVWTWLYLAQHHNKLGNTGEALRYVDACIEHTPTLIEAHSVRARVLKHAGDLAGAAEAAERARSMDLADRYLNCKSAKALFLAGRVDEAETIVKLFTRDGDQNNNLFDMQATWYEIASGRAYLAKKDYGRALKRFLKVDSHFEDFVEDQFDFHGYCVRKQTMRAYVDMLRMEDTLYSHPVYSKAAAGAIAAYVALHDNPPGTKEEQEAKLLASMSEEEAKRYRADKKKAEAKRKKAEAAEAAAAAAAASGKKDKAGAADAKKDPDPHGEALAATEDPLGEATKLVRRLVKAAGDRLQTQLLAFEVYSRKGRLLLALQAVKKAVALAGADHPEVHVATLALANQMAAAERASGVAAEVLKSQVAALLGGAECSADGFHDAWVQQHGGESMAHRLAAAKGTALLHPERVAAACEELAKAGAGGGSHAECVAVRQWLEQEHPASEAEFVAACSQAFPWSREFGGAQCVALQAANEAENGDGDGLVRGMKDLQVDS